MYAGCVETTIFFQEQVRPGFGELLWYVAGTTVLLA
jgi:hypothetical protein